MYIKLKQFNNCRKSQRCSQACLILFKQSFKQEHQLQVLMGHINVTDENTENLNTALSPQTKHKL